LLQLAVAFGVAYALFLVVWFRWTRARPHAERRMAR
jgi:hypothetical protein